MNSIDFGEVSLTLQLELPATSLQQPTSRLNRFANSNVSLGQLNRTLCYYKKAWLISDLKLQVLI